MKYIIKRLLISIPVLACIAITLFLVSDTFQIDPVDKQYSDTDAYSTFNQGTIRNVTLKRKKLGLNYASFYFKVDHKGSCDTLHSIAFPLHRKFIKRLSLTHGNYTQINKFYTNLLNLSNDLPEVLYNNKPSGFLVAQLESLFHSEDGYDLIKRMRQKEFFDNLSNGFSAKRYSELLNLAEDIIIQSNSMNKFIPTLHWQGKENRFHHWLLGNNKDSKGILFFDFGRSFITQEKVTKKVAKAILITLQFTFLSILLSLAIAIPIGLYSGAFRDSRFDKIMTAIVFGFYALPAYWVGILLIMFLGKGGVIPIFPTFGLGEITSEMSLVEVIREKATHLFLPVVCLVYPSLAFISRHVRNQVIINMDKEYVKTGRIKGLKNKRLLWRHIFPNSAFPLITLIPGILSFTFGGAVVIEMIFGIPGMGRLTVDAILAGDQPVVVGVVLFSAFVTVIGFLLADILYKFADPRIKLN